MLNFRQPELVYSLIHYLFYDVFVNLRFQVLIILDYIINKLKRTA